MAVQGGPAALAAHVPGPLQSPEQSGPSARSSRVGLPRGLRARGEGPDTSALEGVPSLWDRSRAGPASSWHALYRPVPRRSTWTDRAGRMCAQPQPRPVGRADALQRRGVRWAGKEEASHCCGCPLHPDAALLRRSRGVLCGGAFCRPGGARRSRGSRCPDASVCACCPQRPRDYAFAGILLKGQKGSPAGGLCPASTRLNMGGSALRPGSASDVPGC